MRSIRLLLAALEKFNETGDKEILDLTYRLLNQLREDLIEVGFEPSSITESIEIELSNTLDRLEDDEEVAVVDDNDNDNDDDEVDDNELAQDDDDDDDADDTEVNIEDDEDDEDDGEDIIEDELVEFINSDEDEGVELEEDEVNVENGEVKNV